MPVGEFVELIGDLSVAEVSLRVQVSEDLEIPFREIGSRLTAVELDEWALLYDVEHQAAQLEAENARRRPTRRR